MVYEEIKDFSNVFRISWTKIYTAVKTPFYFYCLLLLRSCCLLDVVLFELLLVAYMLVPLSLYYEHGCFFSRFFFFIRHTEFLIFSPTLRPQPLFSSEIRQTAGICYLFYCELVTTTQIVYSVILLSSRPIELADRRSSEETDQRSNDGRSFCARSRVRNVFSIKTLLNASNHNTR